MPCLYNLNLDSCFEKYTAYPFSILFSLLLLKNIVLSLSLPSTISANMVSTFAMVAVVMSDPSVLSSTNVNTFRYNGFPFIQYPIHCSSDEYCVLLYDIAKQELTMYIYKNLQTQDMIQIH